MSQAADVKQAVDALAATLARVGSQQAFEKLRGPGKAPLAMHYMAPNEIEQSWAFCPYFDLYDLAWRINGSEELDGAVRNEAQRVMKAVERFIVRSFGMEHYDGFQATQWRLHRVPRWRSHAPGQAKLGMPTLV